MPEVMQISCFEEHIDYKSLPKRSENKQEKKKKERKLSNFCYWTVNFYWLFYYRVKVACLFEQTLIKGVMIDSVPILLLFFVKEVPLWRAVIFI